MNLESTYNIAAELPFLIAITHASNLDIFILTDKWIGFLELILGLLLAGLQNLLAEVVVDEGCLDSQIPR